MHRRGLLLGGLGAPLLSSFPSYAEDFSSSKKICESTIVHIGGTDGDIYLVGVAHLSNFSTTLARQAVQLGRPDLVMVELDRSRVAVPQAAGGAAAKAQEEASGGGVPQKSTAGDAMASDTTPPPRKPLRFLDPLAPIQKKEVPQAPPPPQAEAAKPPLWQSLAQGAQGAVAGAAAGLLRKALEFGYQLAGQFLDESAGSEMVAAIEEAAEVGAPVLLGDLPAQRTLQRIVAEVPNADLDALDAALGEAVPEFGTDMIYGPQDLQSKLEAARDQATTQKLREAFKASAPGLFAALVGERDEFMAAGLWAALRAKNRRVVAIVGSIHVPGITEALLRRGSLRVVDTCVY